MIKFVDKLLFTKHLAIMIKSGIPLAEALSILEKQSINSNLKKIIGEVFGKITNGKTLHEGLEAYPKDFDKLYLSLITVGEESGNLETNLEYLAVQLQKAYEFKKKVQGAMLYPGFIVAMAFVLGAGISIFVLPQMANLCASLDIELPISTKILIGTANIMKSYGLIIIPGIVALFAALGFVVNTSAIKPYWHRLLLNIPIVGIFIKDSEAANFCRNLGLMLKSGFPVAEALTVVANSAENLVFRDYVLGISTAVESGRTMESELEDKKYRHLPVIVGKMIGVGERTGKLEDTLLYLGDFFEEEVDGMAKNLPTILEPVLLTGIALLVAFMAMAIVTPIYQFTSSIHR